MSFKSFSDYLLLEKNYSPLTINAYQKDLESFQKFNQEHFDEVNIKAVNYSQIRSWIISLVESGIANRSINRKISSLNTYYKFLLKVHGLEVNPLAKHKALKTSKKVQIPFSENEINSVLDDFNFDDSFEGIRDKLIIELFYSTGIRRIELVQLKLMDIDVSNNTIKVLGKRNEERLLPLLNTVVETIKKYLIKRQELQIINDKEYLFLTKKGVKIYETFVYRIINGYFSRVSTKVKKSPKRQRGIFN